jgi:hypothetical protein
MSDKHAFSHLITFVMMGGIAISFGILLLNSGGGLYA